MMMVSVRGLGAEERQEKAGIASLAEPLRQGGADQG
jgi:hypothetical protein